MAVIEVREFIKSFGNKMVHCGVTFSVEQGTCMGLIGGSGSGKSVLLRSLIALENPDSGSIKVLGNEVTTLKGKPLIEHRKRVAYAFQGGALFDSMSVYDNLAYPLREHTVLSEKEISDKICETLDEFGLAGNEDVYPVELSGGMQKRLGLARAIVIDPEVVLYDEPTAGLDPYNTRKIQEMIQRLKYRGVTSILVTHDMPTAFAVCDEISLLVSGVIEATEANHPEKPPENEWIRRFTDGEGIPRAT